MRVLVYILIVAVALFIAFIVWRIMSVARGIRQRDERLARELDPLAKRLEQKATISRDEVFALARKPQLRYPLYALLKQFNRLDLFPAEFLSDEAQGAAKLAHWMMHPNELQDAPREIELVERVARTVDERECSFLVYRYRMPESHWAASDGWILGLAGPFAKSDPPYEGPAGAFSRCGDKHGVIKPDDPVDWFIGMVKRKSS
jgi:hypothetical protein